MNMTNLIVSTNMNQTNKEKNVRRFWKGNINLIYCIFIFRMKIKYTSSIAERNEQIEWLEK